MTNPTPIHAALLGLAVGDALGVPVEFLSREQLEGDLAVTDIRGWGTHNQPPGTWSDDASLTFCLAEMLCEGYSLPSLAKKMIDWYDHAYWTPHGIVFDIGVTTAGAIRALSRGTAPTEAGGAGENENGNGALMRILPLLFHLRSMTITERFRCIADVASLTHRHIRSTTACFIYLEIARALLDGRSPLEALETVRASLPEYRSALTDMPDEEWGRFHRIFPALATFYDPDPIEKCEEANISSSGYVVSTLEAALWSLLTTDNYPDAVLRAVNLGSDTDTTAAVCGGLAGLVYGVDGIPELWIEALARVEDIRDLAGRLDAVYRSNE
jgi:ADP-ribosyl-[dinitrogen reductase] hydrolase